MKSPVRAAAVAFVVTCFAASCGDISVHGTGDECAADEDCVGVVTPQNECQVPACAEGSCIVGQVTDGTSCDDGNPATSDDACKAGACVGAACTCTEAGECCDGCLPISEGEACTDDGVTCTNDLCKQGACVHSAASGSCYIDSQCHADGDAKPSNDCQYCDSFSSPAEWRDKLNDVACDDGDAGTGDDMCADGVCAGTKCNCTTMNFCCDGCFFINNGGSCDDDGIECTSDVCVDGECTHEVAAGSCLIDGDCWTDGTNNPDNTCQYCDSVFAEGAWRNKVDSSPCDDSNACTKSDTCGGGVCEGSDPVVCEASDQCHDVGTCDPATGGCSNPEMADNTACDDGNENTGNDHCEAGVCLGSGCICGNLGDCCDGCLPINDEGPCADEGLACTSDACSGGTCVHEPLAGACVIEACR